MVATRVVGLVPFAEATEVTGATTNVGGKAFSLIRLTQQGLHVPGGVALGVDFFEPYWKQVKALPEYTAFLAAGKGADYAKPLTAASKALKAKAVAIVTMDVAAVITYLEQTAGTVTLWAVRSSSPEEDLEGASFAGGYETVLGVTHATLAAAVATCFVSALDERVAMYKAERSFPLEPKIAVVVQQMVQAQSAGVAFSVSPLTNDYDEAVINSNYGLGESVVSGQVTPDEFVMNRLTKAVVNKRLGRKELAIWLEATGGTRDEHRKPAVEGDFSITDAQAVEIVEEIARAEAVYKVPVDIEWAFDQNGKLFLLQSRPITTHFELAPELMTKPGERRRLYLDITNVVQGIFEPMSTMGESTFGVVLGTSGPHLLGRTLTNSFTCAFPPFRVAQHRIYMLSSLLMSWMGHHVYAENMAVMDVGTSKALHALEGDVTSEPGASKPFPYPHKVPALMGMAWRHWRAKQAPESWHATAWGSDKAFRAKLKAIFLAEQGVPLTAENICAYVNSTSLLLTVHLADVWMPCITAAGSCVKKIRVLVSEGVESLPEEVANDLQSTESSLPDNVTVAMGLELDKVAIAWGHDPKCTKDTMLEAIRSRPAAKAEFNKLWDAFIEEYGSRGNREIDVQAKRNREDAGVLVGQMAQIARRAEDEPTEAQRCVERVLYREAATTRLESWLRSTKGESAVTKFRSLHKVVLAFGGGRESHKELIVMLTNAWRVRLCNFGAKLAQEGVLDSADDVFHVSLDDLHKNELRSIVAANKKTYDRVLAVPPPNLVDSRGRIYRAPPPENVPEGAMLGAPCSNGKVQGRVKVLHYLEEKELFPGEILVTRATDPSWTLLFPVCGGLVLEIGGALQHGALVAREYRKPCVSGIVGVMDMLQDGWLVEVDGTTGLVTVLDKTPVADQ